MMYMSSIVSLLIPGKETRIMMPIRIVASALTIIAGLAAAPFLCLAVLARPAAAQASLVQPGQSPFAVTSDQARAANAARRFADVMRTARTALVLTRVDGMTYPFQTAVEPGSTAEDMIRRHVERVGLSPIDVRAWAAMFNPGVSPDDRPEKIVLPRVDRIHLRSWMGSPLLRNVMFLRDGQLRFAMSSDGTNRREWAFDDDGVRTLVAPESGDFEELAVDEGCHGGSNKVSWAGDAPRDRPLPERIVAKVDLGADEVADVTLANEPCLFVRVTVPLKTDEFRREERYWFSKASGLLMRWESWEAEKGDFPLALRRRRDSLIRLVEPPPGFTWDIEFPPREQSEQPELWPGWEPTP